MNCFLSSVATDGKDRHGLKCYACKNYPKLVMVSAPWEKICLISSSLTPQEHFGKRHQAMTSAQNWPKTAISLWQSPFMVWLPLISSYKVNSFWWKHAFDILFLCPTLPTSSLPLLYSTWDWTFGEHTLKPLLKLISLSSQITPVHQCLN